MPPLTAIPSVCWSRLSGCSTGQTGMYPDTGMASPGQYPTSGTAVPEQPGATGTAYPERNADDDEPYYPPR
jgi:hypothetical protein